MSLAREDPATGMVAVVRGYYRRARWKRWAIVLLSVIAVAAFLVTIVVGPVDITLPQLLRALVNPSTVDAQTRMVLWQLRIPSSVMAISATRWPVGSRSCWRVGRTSTGPTSAPS